MVQAGRPLLHMYFVRSGLISLTLPPSTAAAVGSVEASNGHVELQVPRDVVFGAESVPRPGPANTEAAEVSVVGPGGWFCEAALLGPPPEMVPVVMSGCQSLAAIVSTTGGHPSIRLQPVSMYSNGAAG